MTARTDAELKALFATGQQPNGQAFADLVDSIPGEAGVLTDADIPAAIARDAEVAAAVSAHAAASDPHGDRAYADAAADARKTLSDYQNVVVVDAGGNGDFSTVSAALAAITGESNTNQYAIAVFGTVNDTSVVLRPYIHLIGVGRWSSRVICSGSFVLPTVPSASGNRIPNNFVNLTIYASDITGSVASYANFANCTLDAPVLIQNSSNWRATDTFFRRTVTLTMLTVSPFLDVTNCVFGAVVAFGTAPTVSEDSLICNGGVVRFKNCYILNSCSFTSGSLEAYGSIFESSVSLSSGFSIVASRFVGNVTLNVQPSATSFCCASYFASDLVGAGAWTNVRFAYNTITGAVTNVQFKAGVTDGLNVKSF